MQARKCAAHLLFSSSGQMEALLAQSINEVDGNSRMAASNLLHQVRVLSFWRLIKPAALCVFASWACFAGIQ